MVTSPSNALLLQESPRDAVAPEGATCDASGVKPARGVVPASGVVLNDKVGRAPATVGEPAASVDRETAVIVAVGEVVNVGAARAVCVNCRESCAMAVETAAVLIAFTSTVGAGVAPSVQDVSSIAAVSTIMNLCRGDF